jgi:hypothetical protein
MVQLLFALSVLAAPDAGHEAPDDVTVEVLMKKPLQRVRGALRGRLEVRLHNGRASAVTLQNRDVHGFRFQPVDGGAAEALIHSCDCAFELGIDSAPETRTIVLVPGETRTLEFDDFVCSGGPYRSPLPGHYTLSYRIGPPLVQRLDGGAQNPTACNRVIQERWNQPFASQPITVRIRGR